MMQALRLFLGAIFCKYLYHLIKLKTKKKHTHHVEACPNTQAPAAVAAAVHPRRLIILHFNDVYNVEAGANEPVGGASRLAYKVTC